jgi:hypothetical protein
VNLTNLVRKAGIEKHALGCGGFAGVYVGADSDIAIATDGGCARQGSFLWELNENLWYRFMDLYTD